MYCCHISDRDTGIYRGPFPSPGKRSARGFTLVEMLVVVGVIGILSALLFPSFLTARRAAWGSGCVSNLKQIGVGIQLYAQDWDDLFPYGIDFADRAHVDFWHDHPVLKEEAYNQVVELEKADRMLPTVLSAQVKSPEVWRCPADAGIHFTVTGNILSGADTGGLTLYEAFKMSYGYRTELALLQKPMTSLREPSKVNVLMDGAGYWHTRFYRPPKEKDDTSDIVKWGYNVLFADGSARNVTSGAYFEAWGSKREDRDPFEDYVPFED